MDPEAGASEASEVLRLRRTGPRLESSALADSRSARRLYERVEARMVPLRLALLIPAKSLGADALVKIVPTAGGDARRGRARTVCWSSNATGRGGGGHNSVG